VALFFLYTGVELGLGLWIYSLLTESRGVAPEVAGIVTGGYWAMFTVGRIFAGWYAKMIDIRKLIYLSISLALFGVALLLADSSLIITILGVTLVGFAIAPIFPGLVSSTTSRVGFRHQANTIGMQIAAAGLGVAVVPSIAGVLARIFGLEVIPLYLLSTLALLLLVFIISNSHSGENT
jgi:fucose permease